MAELQSPEPEASINGGNGGGGGRIGGQPEKSHGQSLVGSKRQRRPSVRLGDIGDQPATLSHESHVKRSKQWNDLIRYRHPCQSQKDVMIKGSKTRALTNLSNGKFGNGEDHETLDVVDDRNNNTGEVGGGFDSLLQNGNWKLKDLKSRRGVGKRRVRSSWGWKVDEGGEGVEKVSGEEDGDEGGFRDFDPNSPAHSMDVDLKRISESGDGLFQGKRRQIRSRVSEGRDRNDGVELEVHPGNDDDREDWNCGTSDERNEYIDGGRRCRSLEGGVHMWLNELGLGQYVPVFEIHEVDEEVLPLLTLDDLKDMGINAVGPRRKLLHTWLVSS